MISQLRLSLLCGLLAAGSIVSAQTTGTTQQTTGSTTQQSSTGTQQQSSPTGTVAAPSVSVPGMGAISESTLQSMGFSDDEINEILGAVGAPVEVESPTNAIEQTNTLLEQNTQSSQQSQEQTSTETQQQEPEQQTEQTQTQDAGAQQGAASPATIYGQGFFRNGSFELFDKVPNAKVSDTYIMGSGDQISISVYGGVSSYNESFTVSEDGYIDIYGIGKVFLKGLTYEGAKKLLRQRYSGYINLAGSNFDVSLVYSKSIKVNIVGEVTTPGSYNIASINTAFNALTAAGGPNDLGSVRNIQIKRSGKVVATLDVYEFLMNPGSTDDTYLMNNDYIVVGPIGRVVELTGEVKRPFKYELKGNEQLNELINYAGGLKGTAYTRTVTVKRFADNENQIIDINLDSLQTKGINFEVLDGDVIVIAKIPEVVENVVSITGSVRFPGTYQLSEGLRISDLIDKAKGLNYDAYTERAYLIRKNDKLNDVYIPFDLSAVIADKNSAFNFELTKFDVIEIFTKEKFREVFNVNIEGAVKAPGQFPYYEQMTLKDLLYYSGGLRVEAANNKIEISRIVNFDEARSENEPTRVVIESISVDKNLEIADAAENFPIQPYDMVFVRSTPEFELQKNITLQGEVTYPGTYTLLSKTETITDVIERAGGVTQYAYVEGATISRNDITNVLLFLDKAMKDPESKYNYVLREGDVIVVPRQGDLVSLEGAIDFPFLVSEADQKSGSVMVPFDGGRTARFYVKKYGRNFSDDADKSETYVVQPNGYVKRTHNFLWFIHFYPRVKVKGSVVVVPLEPEKQEEEVAESTVEAEPFDWNVFMATISASILSFATIYVLVNNSNRN